MASVINNDIWDKNGSCLKCGFIPFKLTDECYICNPIIKVSNDTTNNCHEDDEYDIDYNIEYSDEQPVMWEINREKTIIIDEDKSSYEEMFESLEEHNERGDTESIHVLEDQIYRRFIKDIALKKITKVNTIFELANKINDIIIKPNDGSWDTCRWYV